MSIIFPIQPAQPVPVARSCPINPVIGGGALKVSEVGKGGSEGNAKEGVPTQRARATGRY